MVCNDCEVLAVDSATPVIRRGKQRNSSEQESDDCEVDRAF
jgi:hypothetical protein